ncbi:Mur ligase family protein [Herbiconiux moechotypicola]|uniref:tetrahydrofolate synthase n=1 Tax=Herbiconiux moechotypicola TaxID=637393 RepID=A0ABN3DFA6_9MICO|nr:Mur ligase family protein [Herbiconiux moechotypicola]MCS5729367.1 Mur ligase family protein [Herbiconiux moechotypicola]
MRTTADTVAEALYDRTGEAAPEPRLDATRRVLDLLGRPDDAFRFIHVTGTNGKTSTSRMSAALLRAHGQRTGLFTSPHLVRFAERIDLGGRPIDDAVLERVYDEVAGALAVVDAELLGDGRRRVTFFEALTAVAYTAFARDGLDTAVVEVGMGGSWDSTNVADGSVAVFTPIALDHVAQLGSTVGEIAATKAGIIKREAVAVTAPQPEEAMRELRRAARARGVPLRRAGRDFTVTSHATTDSTLTIDLTGPFGAVTDARLGLAGRHQAMNAAVAVTAVDAFLGTGRLDPDAVRAALAAADSPGRLQIVSRTPLVVLDAAHNPAGAQSLAAALAECFTGKRFGFVLSVLDDKDARGIVRALAGVAGAFFATASASERAIAAEELARLVAEEAPGIGVRAYERPRAAVDAATAWASGSGSRGVAVTGSITLIGEFAGDADEPGGQ